MAARKRILLLFDLSVSIKPMEYDEYWKTADWKVESAVRKSLLSAGHEVIPLGIFNDVRPLIDQIQESKPDLIFNLSEAFNGKRDHEADLVSLLELLGIPYTGSGPTGLRLCKDKGLTKEILGYHRLHIPRFIVARRSYPVRSLSRFQFPAFIKPLKLEASEGISQLSFASNESEALERVRYVHERLGVDAIVEEYIDGRELYVGILGNEKLTVFPPRELFFREVPEGEPKIATFRAKWDNDYRKKWGIASGPAAHLPAAVSEKLEEICKKIYRILKIRGYGRIDLRVKETGEIYFIEANPNPSIGKDEDFALSAAKFGLPYDELVAKIVSLSL